MNSRSRTSHLGGAAAPTRICSRGQRPQGRLRSSSLVIIFLLILPLGFLAGCGVESPPRPPRIERPAEIKDLRAEQIGQTLHLIFTLPVLSTDGERLTKPVGLELFRVVAPPGGTPAVPATKRPPWVRLLPREIAGYLRKGIVDYPASLSTQDYKQRLGSTFSFSVVALTRGFRHRAHKSAFSNLAQVKLVDASQPVSNLSVHTTQAALQLSWNPPSKTLSGASAAAPAAYRVYASTSGKPDSFRLLAETETTQFADPSYQFGKTYYFQVRVVSVSGNTRAESEPSATAKITPKDIFPPAVPRRLTAIYTAGAVDLLWTANTDADLAGYNVYRSANGGGSVRINTKLLPTPIFHDTSVSRNENYEYAVTAVDLSGNESGKSKPVKVSTSSPGGP